MSYLRTVGPAVALLSAVSLGVTAPQAAAQDHSQPGAAVSEAAGQVELVFWQSIMHSTNPAEFQAYLERWPDGTFAQLARLNLSALHGAAASDEPQTARRDAFVLYENARFGTRIRYPEGHFVAQPPPENGDGLRFLTPDGATGFAVFGQHDIHEFSPEESLYEALVAGRYDQIPMQRILPSGYEFTAERGEQVVHRRHLIDAHNGVIHVFEGFYPISRADGIGPLMAQIAGSLEGPQSAAVAPPQAALPATPPAQPGAYTTPPRGAPLRQALLDTARVPVEAALGRPILFMVSTLRTAGDWAFLMGTPLEVDGTGFDWLTTPLARDWQADAMSDVVMVLMARQDGQWRVVDHVIGPTDVHWIGWMQIYALPEALFYAP
ncbi:hypothetical protein [Pararhodobacter sp.]|uniref:hypothetical protein n=1 Tax=Pararhodobacter sp. TaxID=2127056 RepID=UPI002AFE1341|nr:hypothetical protein [Pararhodobacter sp.]